VTAHDQYLANLRAELADATWMTERGPRRPTDAQCRADKARYDAEVPLHPDTVAAGEWQDDESERDPLMEDDVPIGYDPTWWGAGL